MQKEAEELTKEMTVPFYTSRIDDVLLHQDVDLVVLINLPPPLTKHFCIFAVTVKTLGRESLILSPLFCSKSSFPSADKVEESYLRTEEEEKPKEYIELPGLPADEDNYQPISQGGKKKDKKPKKDDGSYLDHYLQSGDPELPGGGDGYTVSGSNDGYEQGEHNDEGSYVESEGYESTGGGDGYIDSGDDHGYEHEAGYNDEDSYVESEGYEPPGGGDGYIDSGDDHGYEHEGGSEVRIPRSVKIPIGFNGQV
ncbi:uncharacterized protein [Dendrobates tinctorius]|uniref:uncharacterized protein n=1 Tax=Dendrobates tinctorius TaxID=92724 RepID=UPI003CCA0DAB